MLQKTLTGDEVLEIVKKSLKAEGLDILTTTYDDLGLSGGGTIQFEVKCKPAYTPALWPEGVRGFDRFKLGDPHYQHPMTNPVMSDNEIHPGDRCFNSDEAPGS